MPKPACVKCGRFFRPKRNGVWVMEGMPKGQHAEPGLENAEAWNPYKVWVADLWECRGCGTQIISGWSNHPLREHYQWDFDKAMTGVTHNVYDC